MGINTNDHFHSTLKKELFEKIQKLISLNFGIFFTEKNRHLMEVRLLRRLSDLNLNSFDDYSLYLDKHVKIELPKAIECLTNNETYFFREDYQLDNFVKELLPFSKKNNTGKNKQLTIWSAGCSSGEEAYTIGILIAESELFDGWDIRILGTDINSAVVSHARKGIYGEYALSKTPDLIKKKYFDRKQNRWLIKDNIKAMCNFTTMNILDDNSIYVIGRFNFIFCRNVLMYFDKASKLKSISNFYNRLKPDGVLLLGHTESLLNDSTLLKPVYLENSIVYNRPGETYE